MFLSLCDGIEGVTSRCDNVTDLRGIHTTVVILDLRKAVAQGWNIKENSSTLLPSLLCVFDDDDG